MNQQLKDIPDKAVVDITFIGAIADEEYKNKNVIIEKIGKRFLEFSYNDSGLSKQITRGLSIKSFPKLHSQQSFCQNC